MVLDGIRVVELGLWVAGPAAAGLLGDWGAEVIKVEAPKGGDPMRHFFRLSAGGDVVGPNPPFELDNRGKKSVAVDIRKATGRKAVYKILETADVFVTNLRPEALDKLGFGPALIRRKFPSLVYASITGYGRKGPDRDRPGYDVGAFWARSGIADTLRVGANPPPAIRGGFGDHVTALAAASGILAALVERSKTGEGRVVDVSLLGSGMYCLGWDLAIQAAYGKIREPRDRQCSDTPLLNCYETADQKWFYLIGLEGDRHFPSVTRAVGHPELARDARFRTSRLRRHNSEELIAIFDEAFRREPLSYWIAAFDHHEIWWAPVQTPAEALEDLQGELNGIVVGNPNDRESLRTIAAPVTFGGELTERVERAPRHGEHTDSVLEDVGLSEEQIERPARSRHHPPAQERIVHVAAAKKDSISKIKHEIVACDTCPRLVEHRRHIARVKRRAF